MSALIEIRDVSKAYTRGRQSVEVLHHVTLDILQGDFLALMGPSGSGKTTLLNLIGGLDSPTGGSIAVGGKRIDTLGGTALAKWRSENVGFIGRTLLLCHRRVAREVRPPFQTVHADYPHTAYR